MEIGNEAIPAIVKEFYGITRESENKRNVSILETALFIEDVFKLTLTDDEICEENLGDYEVIVDFIRRKRGVS